MKYKRLLLASLGSFLVILSVVVIGCDPLYTICIQNNTDQTLTIFISRYSLYNMGKRGDVRPGAEIKCDTLLREKYAIEAKNVQGDTTYYRVFTHKELNDIDREVVIPPLKGQ